MIDTARDRTRRFGTLCLLAVAALLVVTNTGWAQRLSPDLLKSGSKVRYAFRDVTADAGRATVKILVDGEQVALGAIVEADGYVLTKASQLAGDDVVVQLRDRRRLDAQVVGLSRDYDVALLKVSADHLPVVDWSPSDVVRVGQWLATPGLSSTPVAVGVVSVAARKIPDERGVLGISIADAEPGAAITQIFPNSGAAKAGLQVGDVITRAADTEISNGAALAECVQGFRPGDTIELLVLRDEEERPIRATLGTQSSSILDRAAFQNHLGGELSNRRAGFPAALQHDTVLAPEDCGGVVVDLSGRAVGMNIARAGRTESFAIPAREVLALVAELKSGKLAPRQFVGTTAAADGE